MQPATANFQQGVRTMNQTTVNSGGSPLDAFTPALEHTRRMLFRPFDPGKWFVLGFVIFLAQLFSSDSGWWGGNRLQNNLGRNRSHGEGLHELQQAAQWCVDHGWLILLIVAAGFIISTIVGVVLQYIGARGHFMFLECVMENKVEVKVPWHNAERPARTLFLWRVAIFILLFWCFVLLFALPLWGIVRAAAGGEFSGIGSFFSLLPFLAIFLPLALLISLADLLVRDFVTPIMVLYRTDLLGAVEKSRALWRGQLGNLALYLLFRLIIAVLTGVVGVTVACFTCCIGALPVISQTITAPLHVFVRSWTLAILEQFGPELRTISRHGAAPAPTV